MTTNDKLTRLGFHETPSSVGLAYSNDTGVSLVVTQSHAHIIGGPVGPEVLEAFSALVDEVQHE